MKSFYALLAFATCIGAVFDTLQLPEFPLHYAEYQKECGVPVKCAGNLICPNVRDWKPFELWAQEQARVEFEAHSVLFDKGCCVVGEEEYDYGMFFTKGLNTDEEAGVQNTMTTNILLKFFASFGECSVRNLLEGACGNVKQSLSLDRCQNVTAFKCVPQYPYRTYNGVCNNIEQPTWGKTGNPLKMEMAPCFDDFVSNARLSTSGSLLPNNRHVMVDVQRVLKSHPSGPVPTRMFNMLGVFFSEFVNADVIGRVMRRVRNATEGFRGCRPDGSNVSRFRSSLTAPLKVFSDDPNYGPLGMQCLNFSPIENANDRCKVTYPTKRNLATSYLDLSSVYGNGDFSTDGKLQTSHCKASLTAAKHRVVTVQFFEIAGLFTQLHNYCVDRIRSCSQGRSFQDVTEKCRALTIGVYQRIIYDELLVELFGTEFHKQCNFNCQYEPELESSVSLIYANGPGRFQHIWIPENLTYFQNGTRIHKPLHEYFDGYDKFNCTSALLGMLDDPINISGLSDSIIEKFFSKDGVRGHCLPCIDLERGRDAGLCPLLSYKHYIDKMSGAGSGKCYKSFNDMTDIFNENMISLFKFYFNSPFDIDVLFSVFEKSGPPGSLLPNIVASATCLEFKRLKCSDRFFYTWNKHLTAAARDLINTIDLKTLLALFGEIEEVPVRPFRTQADTVSAKMLRTLVEIKFSLFCQL